MFLRPRRSGVPSFSAVFGLEVKEKGEERTIVLIHSAAPSPVVVPEKESPHVPNKRKSGCCRARRHPVYVVVRSWLIEKQAKKMQPALKILLVKLSSPGLGPVVVVALSLMSTSLQRNVSCSSSVSRAYASFPATRTEAPFTRRRCENETESLRIVSDTIVFGQSDRRVFTRRRCRDV